MLHSPGYSGGSLFDPLTGVFDEDRYTAENGLEDPYIDPLTGGFDEDRYIAETGGDRDGEMEFDTQVEPWFDAFDEEYLVSPPVDRPGLPDQPDLPDPP